MFEGNLFFVVEFDGFSPPTTIAFEQATFRFSMFNLSLACIGQKVRYQIGSTMGTVEEVDTYEEGVGWGEFLRVRVKIDLTKPLSSGRKLKLQRKSVWVAFQYERLPRFCFHCGIIHHGSAGCLGRSGMRTRETGTQFGPWMRATSLGR